MSCLMQSSPPTDMQFLKHSRLQWQCNDWREARVHPCPRHYDAYSKAACRCERVFVFVHAPLPDAYERTDQDLLHLMFTLRTRPKPACAQDGSKLLMSERRAKDRAFKQNENGACTLPLMCDLISDLCGTLGCCSIVRAQNLTCSYHGQESGGVAHPRACSMTSGAIQQGVPTKVLRACCWLPQEPPRSMVAVTPKSASSTCPLLSIRMLPACIWKTRSGQPAAA